MKDEDDRVIVSAELPGLDQQDIDVEVTTNAVRIAGERIHEQEKQEIECYCRESAYGSFERIIDLPAPVDEGRAEARFSKGVLRITLPKSAQAKAKRKQVEIQSA